MNKVNIRVWYFVPASGTAANIPLCNKKSVQCQTLRVDIL